MMDWPVAELDAVARLRALSRALPHTVLRECVIDAPFDAVWSVAGDLERGVPLIEAGISSVEILHREAEHLKLLTRSRLGSRFELDGVLRPGWVVMRSSRFDIGMAAVPDRHGTGTRFAHFEGTRGFGKLLHPLLWAKIGGDLRRIAYYARAGMPVVR